jgi:hypothetical protein
MVGSLWQLNGRSDRALSSMSRVQEREPNLRLRLTMQGKISPCKGTVGRLHVAVRTCIPLRPASNLEAWNPVPSGEDCPRSSQRAEGPEGEPSGFISHYLHLGGILTRPGVSW